MASDKRRTHLVCHSMGGLVARAALAKPPANLGRIITIGTPHNGSYAPIQAVRGVYSIVRKIAALDLRHTTAELAVIFGAFPGLLHMIPAPALRTPDLFDLQNWPAGPQPDAALLQAARKAQADLPPLPPGGQAVLIVGTGLETAVAARRQANAGEFTYDLSNEGDGTVPLDLALVPGLPTYVTAAGHGQMPNDSDIARAVDNIIVTGATTVLNKLDGVAPQRRAAPRNVSDAQLAALGPPPGTMRDGLGVRQHRELLSEVAASPPQSPTPSVAPAGSSPSAGLPDRLAAAPISRSFVIGRRQQQMLEIRLAHGSITDAEADAYVLGVFRGVAPAGAARAVDAALAGDGGAGPLTDLVARRMVSGGVGEITSLPVSRHRRVRTDTVMLAGLGNIGEYRDTALEAVGESVMRAALLSRLEDFAIVPIGASVGTATSTAISLLVTGLMKALRGAKDARLRGFTVCETDETRYAEIRETLYRLLRTTMFDGIEVAFTELDLPQSTRTSPSPLAPSGPDPVYLLVQQELDGNNDANAVGTVLTAGGKAAIVKRSQRLPVQELQTHLDRVQAGAQGIGDAAAYGQALSRMVLHPELLEVLARECAAAGGNTAHPLVVVHDGAMSRVP